MGIDTKGRIKGFIDYNRILNYIKANWDKNVVHDISTNIQCPLTECYWKYEMNSHSKDNDNWYITSGFITFKYNNEQRRLFYIYNNINVFENEQYYEKLNLLDMVKAETTSISLSAWGSSVEIIKELVEYFGGGWIDENDCDNVPFQKLEERHNSKTEHFLNEIRPIKDKILKCIEKIFGDIANQKAINKIMDEAVVKMAINKNIITELTNDDNIEKFVKQLILDLIGG